MEVGGLLGLREGRYSTLNGNGMIIKEDQGNGLKS